MKQAVKICIVLFLCCFTIYNLNFSFLNTDGKGDTAPSRLLPFNILLGKGFYFDNFLKLYTSPDTVYYFQKTHEHYLSNYPLLPGLISIPVYLPVYVYLTAHNQADIISLTKTSFILEKISASFFASISVALMFLLLFKLSQSIKTSLIFSLIFAFATQTFSISSQFLWQHTFANLFLILSQLLILRGNLIRSLLMTILSIFSRTVFLSYLLIFSLTFLKKQQRFIFLTVSLVGLILFISLNYYLYGFLIGTRAESLSDFNLQAIPVNFTLLLFSPARGILFYTPLIFFALSCIFLLKQILTEKTVLKNTLLLNLIFLFNLLLIYAAYDYGKHVGWEWGDRYLTDGAVSAVILSYYFFRSTKVKFLKIVLIITIGYSLFAQIIGVFYYPKASWDDYPQSISSAHQRLWDFKDNPIIRQMAVGPNLKGLYNFVNLIQGLQAKVYQSFERKCSLELKGKKKILGYQILELNFKNNSPVDWLTTNLGDNLNLTLEQLFIDQNGEVKAESPIIPTLPRIIKSRQTVKVSVVIIPPLDNYDDLVIFPTQTGVSWWISSCKLSLNKSQL